MGGGAEDRPLRDGMGPSGYVLQLRPLAFDMVCHALQVTVFQLEKIYGTSDDAQAFIQSLIKGLVDRTEQWLTLYTHVPRPRRTAGDAAPTGLAVQHHISDNCEKHFWQAPDNPKAKMYKVLKEIIDDKASGTKGTSSAACMDLWL